jgi:glutathione S-transferase
MNIKKIHYFDGCGRGEALRMMMSHAGIQYEDCRFGFDTWPSLKPTMAGGSVPNLEFEDGTKMGATNAMMRMVGAKYGYYPEDPMKAYQNDFLTDMYYDHFNKFIDFLTAGEKQAEMKDAQV